MAPSSFERTIWLKNQRDKDFWLNEDRWPYLFLNVPGSYVCWSVGVGPMASFTRAISIRAVEKIHQLHGPFKHVIKVDLDPAFMSIKYQLAIAAAKELGLLDEEYNRIKEEYEVLRYYSYEGNTYELENYARERLLPRIGSQLSSEKYMLVVENLQWPIETSSFSEDVGLPPPTWAESRLFISVTSQDAYNRSRRKLMEQAIYINNEQVMMLTLCSLHHSAEHIFNMIHQERKEYWHHIAINCFHYAMLIFTKHSQVVPVTSDELIHHWAAHGILPHVSIKEEANMHISISKHAYMHQVGMVILEAFEKYSLLQLPYSPANDPDGATGTAVQFFAYHGLVAECITLDELLDNKKNWISFVDDHGWHVSREWLSQEKPRGPTSLILRGCSQQSPILSKLDHFLLELCFLRVLDLSYTPLKSLPSTIGSLLNLWLLSLRGCHHLKTLSTSSTTSATESSTNASSYSPLSTLYLLQILDMNGVPFSHLPQDLGNQKSNLIYLDMSFSEITIFPPNFFQGMSNLEELILVNCSKLVELSPSMVALSSLTTLEVTGTQIRYFPQKIFEEMQNLQSLKLIDNKKLISLTGSISMVLPTVGLDSFMVEENKLEGHPTLVSFILIRAPHIRRLSLRGCRKLEAVELKNLDALEELDLSATAIKDLSSDIPNLPLLRRLLLAGVPSLRRFPWHMLERLPNVFYLDHCTDGIGKHSDQICSQLCVTDFRFFCTFNYSVAHLVRDGRFFQSFFVQAAPCITNTSKQLQDEEAMVDTKLQELLQKQSTYVDVYRSCYIQEVAIASPITVPLHRTERHVEITGMQSVLKDLGYLLYVTKSISVTCDSSIKYFDCSRYVGELEECELRWCHKMEEVFNGHTQGLKNLRNVHVRNLKSLVCLFSNYSCNALSSLAHLHLEDCPRLKHVVAHGTTLPCLKTLDILFCYNLKTIFIRNAYSQQAEDTCQLPSLQRVRLQELPLLQHFHDSDTTFTAPMWKELHVRGCWSLQLLPRLDVQQAEKVKVSGERRWWSKLQWSPLSRRDSYNPKLPPKFASLDERAVMTSYLR